jgi:hypothetical protein
MVIFCLNSYQLSPASEDTNVANIDSLKDNVFPTLPIANKIPGACLGE